MKRRCLVIGLAHVMSIELWGMWPGRDTSMPLVLGRLHMLCLVLVVWAMGVVVVWAVGVAALLPCHPCTASMPVTDVIL
jgi:hypothetical protein